MGILPRLCECGRTVTAPRRHGRRVKIAIGRADHDLCRRCFRALCDRERPVPPRFVAEEVAA